MNSFFIITFIQVHFSTYEIFQVNIFKIRELYRILKTKTNHRCHIT